MLTARAPALSRSPSTLGRYDIVFLPPSFPIVAMENPCLTFIISSILESDEFLIIDVIHEVAHSWFGNAVTNATWEEMWLSEGLATYAQRRITTETYGTARAGAGAAGPPPGPSGHCVRGWEPSLAPGERPPCRACVQPGGQGSSPQGSGQGAARAAASPLPRPGAAFTCLETAFRLDALHRQMKVLGEDSPVSKLQVKLEPGTHSHRPCPGPWTRHPAGPPCPAQANSGRASLSPPWHPRRGQVRGPSACHRLSQALSTRHRGVWTEVSTEAPRVRRAPSPHS